MDFDGERAGVTVDIMTGVEPYKTSDHRSHRMQREQGQQMGSWVSRSTTTKPGSSYLQHRKSGIQRTPTRTGLLGHGGATELSRCVAATGSEVAQVAFRSVSRRLVVTHIFHATRHPTQTWTGTRARNTGLLCVLITALHQDRLQQDRER